MNSFRICKSQYANDISGIGARLTGGRWNSIGISILYTSENSALSAFELATHIGLSILPNDLCVVTFEILNNLVIEEVKNLPNDWNTIPPNYQTKEIGDNFIRRCETPILKVPSVVIKGAYNYLINPNHRESQQIKTKDIDPFSFDQRLQYFE